eukprot:SAG31_NODE_1551_length_7907_cov_29.930072_5_plen_1649_part_00
MSVSLGAGANRNINDRVDQFCPVGVTDQSELPACAGGSFCFNRSCFDSVGGQLTTNGGNYRQETRYKLYFVEPGSGPRFRETQGIEYDNPLQRLDVLAIENNLLDGEFPDLLPYCQQRAAGTLSSFTFHGNNFGGKLPKSFAFCTGITDFEIKGMPQLEGPLPDMEPSLRSCSACLPFDLRGTGDCPRWTEAVVYDPIENPYPGTDDNGAYFRSEGVGQTPDCCRMYQCFTGGFAWDPIFQTHNPVFEFADTDAAADCSTVCESGFDSIPTLSSANAGSDISADAARRCKIYANEYDYFNPRWLFNSYNSNDPEDLCASGGLTYSGIEHAGGSTITSFKLDGASMNSMSGLLPQLDNSNVLHTIEVTSATWLQNLPAMQTQNYLCVQSPTDSTYGIPMYIANGVLDDATTPAPYTGSQCPWTGLYTGLRTLKIDHSITPDTADGKTFAVHPTLHVGDFHGHPELATVSLKNNNLKGDLPNVDDPHGDQDDDLVTYHLNHNSFGYPAPALCSGYVGQADCVSAGCSWDADGNACNSCVDRSACAPGDTSCESENEIDCVPHTFRHLYKLNDFELTYNEMSSSIPLVFFKLSHLLDLDLSHNSYSRFIETEICQTYAECTCTTTGDPANGDFNLYDMYHRPMMEHRCASGTCTDSLVQPETRIPPVGQANTASFFFDISYNNVTDLPMYLLRGFKRIHAANNDITAEGTLWKETYHSDGSLNRESFLFPLPFGGCDAYSYPALQILDLSGNDIGDCTIPATPSQWATDCPALAEEMLSDMTELGDLVTLDLSGNAFEPKVDFPDNWRMAEYWPAIKQLKLGHIFTGRMSYESMNGAEDSGVICPLELQTLHLMGGELSSEIKLSHFDSVVARAALEAKFPPYELDWDSRRVSVLPADSATPDSHTSTKVVVQVLKEASFASEDGPRAGLTAVTATRLANAIGVDFVVAPLMTGPTCDIDKGDEQCELCTSEAGVRAALPFCDSIGAFEGAQLDNSPLRLELSSGETAENRLQMEAQAAYRTKTAMIGYAVRHMGCPGMGCGGSNVTWKGPYEVSFTLLSAEPVTPPFFACKSMTGLDLQGNQFGGLLSRAYTDVDYGTIVLNGGLPHSLMLSVVPMPHLRTFVVDGNNFTGPVPAIAPRRLPLAETNINPCAEEYTNGTNSPPGCTPQSAWTYRMVFSEAGPTHVQFCTQVSDGVDCGANQFDCPIPQIPQAFFVRNRANGPFIHRTNNGFCGCDECAMTDSDGNLLRACRHDCACACECNSASPDWPSCRGTEPDVYTECSPRVKKFSYTHPVYDTIDCSCPSGSDCAGQFGSSASDDFDYDPLMCRAWCSECSPGRSSSGVDVDFCPNCAPGYFTSEYGQESCAACALGTYSEGAGGVGSGGCQLCPEGRFNMRTGSPECLNATPGSYVDFEGAYCLPYPGDSYTTCDMPNSTEQGLGPKHCNGGLHSPRAGMASCEACPTGRFSLPAGMYAECTACPPGTRTDPNNTQALLCKKCDPGFFQATPGADECQPSRPGFYSDAFGLDYGKVCPGNSISQEGAVVCETCPENMKANEEHVECKPCGTFDTSEGCKMDPATVAGVAAAGGTIVLLVLCAIYNAACSGNREASEQLMREASEGSEENPVTKAKHHHHHGDHGDHHHHHHHSKN